MSTVTKLGAIGMVLPMLMLAGFASPLAAATTQQAGLYRVWLRAPGPRQAVRL
jgi:hypothetical protein